MVIHASWMRKFNACEPRLKPAIPITAVFKLCADSAIVLSVRKRFTISEVRDFHTP